MNKNRKGLKNILKVSDRSLFLICLILAGIFWLLNALTKDFKHQVLVKMDYQNFPKEMVATNRLVEDLKVDVIGEGFQLLQLNFTNQKIPVSIDFEQLGNEGKISSSDFIDQISAGLQGIKISNVFPEEIEYKFEARESKFVPLLLDAEISTAPSYFVKGNPQLEPNEVLVTGPSSLISSILFWETVNLEVEELQSSESGKLELKPTESDLVSIEPNECSYKIEIDQWTEKSFELNIEAANLPDSTNAYLYPQKAMLKIQIPISEYEVYKDSLFNLVADFAKIDLKNSKNVSIELGRKAPQSVRAVNISPSEIEFLIYK